MSRGAEESWRRKGRFLVCLSQYSGTVLGSKNGSGFVRNLICLVFSLIVEDVNDCNKKVLCYFYTLMFAVNAKSHLDL